MLAKADFPVAEAEALLSGKGLVAAFLSPTAIGMAKSLMDATRPVRRYLREQGFHDYDLQPKGRAHKRSVDAWFVGAGTLEHSVATLYRPETKAGDPRIWLGDGTRRHARPRNLLALVVLQGRLHVLNMSDPVARATLEDPESPFMKAARIQRESLGAQPAPAVGVAEAASAWRAAHAPPGRTRKPARQEHTRPGSPRSAAGRQVGPRRMRGEAASPQLGPALPVPRGALAQVDFPVAEALEILTSKGIEAALLVPTHTGMSKSIMDATGDVRDYLRDTRFHDYSQQAKGGDAKASREACFVQARSLEPTVATLYRPMTKDGDPRIWLGRATRGNARAGNLLALVVLQGKLHILNMSDASVRRSLDDPGSPFMRVVAESQKASPVAEELLGRLREICRRGFVRTLRPGDTGVGMTLESMLGIAANSRRSPDYNGIELKAKRRSGRTSGNRSTLFSKVPDWKLSPVGSAMALLNLRGYKDSETGRLQLYHTLHGQSPNSLGLMLQVEAERRWLKQVHVGADGHIEHDTTWRLDGLEVDLGRKHGETFWVQAECRGRGSSEEFHYVQVHHTRRPVARNLPPLLEAGVITIDYTLSVKGNRAHDHGYLFRIHPSHLGTLFPPAEIHDLAA